MRPRVPPWAWQVADAQAHEAELERKMEELKTRTIAAETKVEKLQKELVQNKKMLDALMN